MNKMQTKQQGIFVIPRANPRGLYETAWQSKQHLPLDPILRVAPGCSGITSAVGCTWAFLSWRKPGTCSETTGMSSVPAVTAGAHVEQELSPAASWWHCSLSDLSVRRRLSRCPDWCFPNWASQESCFLKKKYLFFFFIFFLRLIKCERNLE